MMLSEIDVTTPTLDEPNLPEFRGATLSLSNGSDKGKILQIQQDKTAMSGAYLTRESQDRTLKEENAARDHLLRQQRDSSPKTSEENPLNSGLVIAHGFFSSRDTILQRAILDCKNTLIREEHGTFQGCWLLTLVDHWDNEKERLILLCSRAIFIVKYDFIALVLVDFESLQLQKITRLTVGSLEYPARSIAPKFQSLAGRFSTILRGCYNQPREMFNWRSTSGATEQAVEPQDTNSFTRLDRDGLRISWGTIEEPKLTQMWNPWSKDIPWLTFLSHPLLSSEQDPKFDVNDFTANLHRSLQNEWQGVVEYKPIVMETYIGIPALIYNYSQFGFYRVRGKVSF